MAVTAVVGAQWGDEAKGKVVDLLSPQAAIVARFNGVIMPGTRWSTRTARLSCA